ncbi:hypothetical protein [Xanthomonas sp. XNM01]|uniref:hypothetical protein n=1 Tax=Xanthomonas sp. XNM01 TaxID=2769289 RepID=UPI001CE06EDA|nr:hypothetical protein [Xanthomonas sp. XNM01]
MKPMSPRRSRLSAPVLLALSFGVAGQGWADDTQRRWLPGDHHVHSEWSVDWDRSTAPPTPIRGGDSPYSRSENARRAQANGLAWMVHTDHGGPGHSRVTDEHAWPALQLARREVPGVIQFHGMEFDVPAAEHASLIIAPGPDEHAQLVGIERDYNRREVEDGSRDSGQAMLDALAHMRGLQPTPVLFVNHPSRTAAGLGVWGAVTPAELRAWQDTAPRVVIGMEGAPGHQAAPGTEADHRHRGFYRNPGAPTIGGFDQMTAQVGSVWDAMLAEGRRFWITASSDSHRNTELGGADFQPGEYSRTYVWARPEADDVLDGMRGGRMFAVTGDLIDALELRVSAPGNPAAAATLGGTLHLPQAQAVHVELRVREPAEPNRNGDTPRVDHVDLIVGSAGQAGRPAMQVRRIERGGLRREGEWLVLRDEVAVPAQGAFVRVRGSNTDQAEPAPDVQGEDPWQDLWFYSNPVFIEVAR